MAILSSGITVYSQSEVIPLSKNLDTIIDKGLHDHIYYSIYECATVTDVSHSRFTLHPKRGMQVSCYGTRNMAASQKRDAGRAIPE